MYEAVSLNAIMTHESQRLYRKTTFSEGFLQSLHNLLIAIEV